MAYLVRSLVNLRAEIDARWPNRTRRIDGWYRSPAVGISYGHNPDSKGAVHAIDVDRNGIDPLWIVNQATRDGRVLWYMIWNRTLYSRTYGWVGRPYHGASPHTNHIHIEVYRTAEAENYNGPWHVVAGSAEGFGPAPPVAEGVSEAYDHSGYVLASAAQLSAAGRLYRSYADIINSL
jgi:hypothetical protein